MKHYIVLFSLSQANKATGNKVIANLKTLTDEAIAPLWIDSAYIGIPVATASTAKEIWRAAVKGLDETSAFRDMLILELGNDWMCRKDAKAQHWLTKHLGPPVFR